MVINEIIKTYLNKGERPNFTFWRDSTGNEVDLLIRNNVDIQAIEIKSAQTFNSDFFKGLKYFSKLA